MSKRSNQVFPESEVDFGGGAQVSLNEKYQQGRVKSEAIGACEACVSPEISKNMREMIAGLPLDKARFEEGNQTAYYGQGIQIEVDQGHDMGENRLEITGKSVQPSLSLKIDDVKFLLGTKGLNDCLQTPISDQIIEDLENESPEMVEVEVLRIVAELVNEGGNEVAKKDLEELGVNEVKKISVLAKLMKNEKAKKLFKKVLKKGLKKLYKEVKSEYGEDIFKKIFGKDKDEIMGELVDALKGNLDIDGWQVEALLEVIGEMSVGDILMLYKLYKGEEMTKFQKINFAVRVYKKATAVASVLIGLGGVGGGVAVNEALQADNSQISVGANVRVAVNTPGIGSGRVLPRRLVVPVAGRVVSPVKPSTKLSTSLKSSVDLVEQPRCLKKETVIKSLTEEFSVYRTAGVISEITDIARCALGMVVDEKKRVELSNELRAATRSYTDSWQKKYRGSGWNARIRKTYGSLVGKDELEVTLVDRDLSLGNSNKVINGQVVGISKKPNSDLVKVMRKIALVLKSQK